MVQNKVADVYMANSVFEQVIVYVASLQVNNPGLEC